MTRSLVALALGWLWFDRGLKLADTTQLASQNSSRVSLPRDSHCLYENQSFFDTRNEIAETIEFADLESAEIGRDFCTPLCARFSTFAATVAQHRLGQENT